ncbi:alpha-galactosidase [Cellulomonas hominis]|uniref:alpha-galactosidase n=1 Tax=Cellulomonas hominis TaxID=156981 RepID=UPI0014445F55|nr:alpha-galactosidase [Cellulomonas hominis]
MRPVDTLPAAAPRIYTEGWQSWSPAGWWTPGRERPAGPAHDVEQAMRRRPGRPAPDGVLRGEGLVLVDPGDGSPVRVYAATDPEGEVPSLDVRVAGGRVEVLADGAVSVSEASGVVEAFDAFGRTWSARAGRVVPTAPAPRVWCSWYQYFERVTAADVAENARGLDRLGLPVDVVQLDDGWLRLTGEYLAPREAFGAVPDLLAAVRDGGRDAGVWLAPFAVGADSALAREHPDWLVAEAGFNWGQTLVGLDLTHPGVRSFLTAAVERIRALGVRYVKADFLYAGAVPGSRHDRRVSGTEAYRSGLRLLRDLLGPDVYLVGCGAPLLPSVGLVDAMRVSPDTFHEGAEDGSAGLRGRAPLEARAWQHGRLWANDPDCAVLRPGFALREEWLGVVSRAGGLRSFSDRVADLDDWGIEAARRLLGSPPPAGPLADEVVTAAVPR